MLIQRLLEDQITTSLEPGKVVVLYGPRRVGKTTLIKQILEKSLMRTNLINADEITYREALSSQNKDVLKSLIGQSQLLVVDEAQRIANIGLNLKIITDQIPNVRVLVTGSASLDLAGKINEPLTGRKKTFYLYPLSVSEILNTTSRFELQNKLESLLVWGSYPEAYTISSEKERSLCLSELVSSYLYKDILEMEGVRHSEKIVDLLRLLAFQIGFEVSYAELASNLDLNRETVERYIDLLEKSFVLYRLKGFSRNLRKEIVKNDRLYFVDNGVRNALINNFNALKLRQDVGQLWENFIVMEKIKKNAYEQRLVNHYFWRTYDQKEIDLVEEAEGKLVGYEIKWSGEVKRSTVNLFEDTYPNSEVHTINKENYLDFLLDKSTDNN